MAIATVERDATRGSGASEPRFKLIEEICRTGDQQFWRATDRRNGKGCVVRVIDADREDSARRLGELHRERLVAERIAHAAVLRPDVPLIEGERTYQLVQPEPARRVETVQAEGRLATLHLLASAGAALAEAHARGAFHGALSLDSLLRSAEGRVILQGFSGDATNAAAAREGAAADHLAFLTLAQQLLAPTGGPPPRLRRYFARELAPGAPRAAAGAMAALAEELRDSLEDTFPWPTAVSVAPKDEDGTARLPALSLVGDEPEEPPLKTGSKRAAKVASRASETQAIAAPQTASAPTDAAAVSPQAAFAPEPVVARQAPVVSAPPVASLPAVSAAPQTSVAMPDVVVPAPVAKGGARRDEQRAAPPAPAASVMAAVRAASKTGAGSPYGNGSISEPAAAGEALAPVVVAESKTRLVREAKPPSQAASREREAAPAPASDAATAPGPAEAPRRSLRAWIATAIFVGLLVAGWQYGQRRHAAGSEGPPAPSTPATQSRPLATPAAATLDPVDAAAASVPDPIGADAARVPQALRPPSRAVQGTDDSSTARPGAEVPPVTQPGTRGVAAEGATSRRGTSTPASDTRDSGAAREQAADRAREAAAAQAARSRVANLVAGGNRALNALEPQLAADAFEQALALAPGDRAATEGRQRARRLLGAAALVLDAREAAARGDHGRAVQGYSQALANDPRNRGLAEALAASRRSLARDEAGALLAAGHEALGAGRLERARDAFERALQLDPRDMAARRAAEQAATAILLRDTANERRLAASSP